MESLLNQAYLLYREKSKGRALGLEQKRLGGCSKALNERFCQKFKKGTQYLAKNVSIVWVAKQLSKFCFFKNELQSTSYFLEETNMYFVVIKYFCLSLYSSLSLTYNIHTLVKKYKILNPNVDTQIEAAFFPQFFLFPWDVLMSPNLKLISTTQVLVYLYLHLCQFMAERCIIVISILLKVQHLFWCL